MRDKLEYIGPKLTQKERWERIWSPLIPHRCIYSKKWYKPIWWTFFFGGENDTGNGSHWRPNLIHRIQKWFEVRKIKKEEYEYWQKYYEKYGCEPGDGPQTKKSIDGGKTYIDATPL